VAADLRPSGYSRFIVAGAAVEQPPPKRTKARESSMSVSPQTRTASARATFVRFILPLSIAAVWAVACEHDTPTERAMQRRPGRAQADITTTATTVPAWVGNLLLGSTPLTADPTSTQEEFPGMGHKFQLFGVMMDGEDPYNASNYVVSAVTTPAYPAGAGEIVRLLNPIKINALTDQLSLKYYFPSRSCDGGSPRIQLLIDPGNGTPPKNAFGYVGHAPFGAVCATGLWDFVDMAPGTPDPVARWDLSQFGGTMTNNWQQVLAFFNSVYPNHTVLSGSLVDDSCSFAPGSCGQAYYDLLTIENRTLQNAQDAVH
jgi:hypothetical protein